MAVADIATDKWQNERKDDMTEEESFVILGSSPLPSIASNGKSLSTDGLDKEEPKEIEFPSTSRAAPPTSISQLSATPEQIRSLESSLPATLPSAQSSLAASFLLGEIRADVLKNSVYSQFPSLCSMQASAEDVVKLQAMMTECLALKQNLFKVNTTLEGYYNLTQKRQSEADAREKLYQEQLQQCQEKIDKLFAENQQLKREVEVNLEQLRLAEELHQKEHDELRQSVSEKSSLIENMRVEIDKLQQHQLQSFEYVRDEEEVKPSINEKNNDALVKDLQRQLSALLAENLEFKDMKKTYVDEIDCLKVNLTSAEEIINAMRADITELKAKDAEKEEQLEHLRTQVDIYRRDFEMERADREKNAGEKEQYLGDLRALQRRNQELIEALADAQKSNQLTSKPTGSSGPVSSLRPEQRPVLDPTGAAAKTSESTFRCPICSKSFTSLSVLQSHVNDCLDKL